MELESRSTGINQVQSPPSLEIEGTRSTRLSLGLASREAMCPCFPASSHFYAISATVVAQLCSPVLC